MSLIMNGTEIEKVIYNDTELEQVYMDGVLVWESAFTITYRYGGSVVNTAKYKKGETITTYTPPAQSGKTFVGWTDINGSTAAKTLTATSNMTLYAVWYQGANSASLSFSHNDSNPPWSSDHRKTLSGNWPDNSTLYCSCWGIHRDEEGAGECSMWVSPPGGPDQKVCGEAVGTDQFKSFSGSISTGTHKSFTVFFWSNENNGSDGGSAYVRYNKYGCG